MRTELRSRAEWGAVGLLALVSATLRAAPLEGPELGGALARGSAVLEGRAIELPAGWLFDVLCVWTGGAQSPLTLAVAALAAAAVAPLLWLIAAEIKPSCPRLAVAGIGCLLVGDLRLPDPELLALPLALGAALCALRAQRLPRPGRRWHLTGLYILTLAWAQLSVSALAAPLLLGPLLLPRGEPAQAWSFGQCSAIALSLSAGWVFPGLDTGVATALPSWSLDALTWPSPGSTAGLPIVLSAATVGAALLCRTGSASLLGLAFFGLLLTPFEGQMATVGAL